MPFFPCAHAGHPLWRQATQQVVVQLKAQISMQQPHPQPNLGMVYFAQPYAPHAAHMIAMLEHAFPQIRHWVGCATASVLAGEMDYGDSGALAVLLPCVDPNSFQLFSGAAPWSLQAEQETLPHVLLLHGDAQTADTPRQVQQLVQNVPPSSLNGGLGADAGHLVQIVWGGHMPGSLPASIGGGGVQTGGISGIAFNDGIEMFSVHIQGCKPASASYQVSRVEGQQLYEVEGAPVLEHWLNGQKLQIDHRAMQPDAPAILRRLQQLLVAVSRESISADDNCIPPHAQVHRIVGIDLARQSVLLDTEIPLGHYVTLCQRNEEAARLDIRRACAEIWEELTQPIADSTNTLAGPSPAGRNICGAIYVRSQYRQILARTPTLDAELQLIRHALGPVPLLGFTTQSEVGPTGVQHLSAQLIVFTCPLQPLQ